jgi:dTDP-4-amino-4,6-dideoxy-D-galactose acyltransferase
LMQEPCEYLDWDSQFFGLRIGRLFKARLTSGDVPDVLSWCRERSIDCLYFLSDPEPESLRVAATSEFQLVDTRITLETPLDGYAPEGCRDSRVRPARPDDLTALRAIAGSSHTDSRFYSDNHFPRLKCDELYRVWIEKSCAGWADVVLVAEHRGEPAGYVTCAVTGDRAQIGLIAVAGDAQGVGLGRALLECAFSWMRTRAAVTAWVVTQERNTKAMQFYRAAGFAPSSKQCWYHLWPHETCR